MRHAASSSVVYSYLLFFIVLYTMLYMYNLALSIVFIEKCYLVHLLFLSLNLQILLIIL